MTKLKLPKGSILLRKDDVECISDHIDALFNMKRPTRLEVQMRCRYLYEHLLPEKEGGLLRD